MGEKSSDTSTFYKYSRAPPPGPGRKTRYACNHVTGRNVRMRRRCGSLRKRARFIASALNTIKITVGDRSRGVVNAVQKEEEKKRKSVVWKAVVVFKGQRNEREVPREQWNRFYFPMILDPVWLLRPFRSTRFLLTFFTRSWNIFARKRSFFLITEFRRNFVLFSGRRDSETILLVWWRV